MIDCHHNYARLHEVLTLVAFAVYLSMVLLSIAYQKKKQLNDHYVSKLKTWLPYWIHNIWARASRGCHNSNMPAKATKQKADQLWQIIKEYVFTFSLRK